VTADSLLERLFYNLIDNSLKHGKKVTQIRLSYRNRRDALKLIYEDNGTGIPRENKQRIFSGGFTTGKGTGLGLKLVKELVEAYGWTIEENGVPGEGARFQITIPMLKN
jgi:signal transduction histidine kinase